MQYQVQEMLRAERIFEPEGISEELESYNPMIPDGTKIRVRLEQNLSSESAELGQTVDFVVTQEVRIGDVIIHRAQSRRAGITHPANLQGGWLAGEHEETMQA